MGSVGLPKFDVFGEYFNTIDGKLSSTKQTRHSINPATGKPNPEVPCATQEDLDAAVEAATRAADKWAAVPYKERQAALNKFADALEAHTDDFAKLLTQEQGKPVCTPRGNESELTNRS